MEVSPSIDKSRKQIKLNLNRKKQLKLMDLKEKALKEKLLKSISKTRLKTISNIINRKNKKMSIRLIEWFVSSYSKRHKTKYELNGAEFNVYKSYKDEQLCSFNKKLFDMYKRTTTFTINLDDGTQFDTTVAQLNFFYWAIKHKVVNYVENNLQDIKNDLSKNSKLKKTKKKNFYDDTLVSNIKIILSFA